MRIRTVSSSIANAETSDAMLKCNCAANAISVYLSASSAYMDDVNVKKVDSSANVVTIYPYGTETIDGASSVTLSVLNEKKTLIAVDGGWSVSDNVTDVGAATATSINGVTITAPASSATLTIADGKTLTASNSITLAGTDAKTLNIGANDVTLTTSGATGVTLPTTGTLATLAGAETLTNKTLTSPNVNEAVALARTATQLNLITQGVASGYKIARGTTTPTTASDTVATGLATVVAVIVSFKGAPSLTHMFNYGDVGNQAGAPVAGSFLLKSSKPTAAADVTPIASTTPWGAVDWIAIGT